MIYEPLVKQIKKHFFIIFSEKFSGENSETHIERYVAKHFLLRPELIVVNDQVHGFKKLNEKVKNLEKFPIYLEIEYHQPEDEDKYLDNIDLYAEANVDFSDKLSDILYLANLYSRTIALEKISPLASKDGKDSLMIYSKINDLFSEGYLEQDIEEGLLSPQEIESMIEVHLVSFVNFLKLLDDLLHKGKDIKQMDKLFNRPIEE
jgi:hypothetical protein